MGDYVTGSCGTQVKELIQQLDAALTRQEQLVAKWFAEEPQSIIGAGCCDIVEDLQRMIAKVQATSSRFEG